MPSFLDEQQVFVFHSRPLANNYRKNQRILVSLTKRFSAATQSQVKYKFSSLDATLGVDLVE